MPGLRRLPLAQLRVWTLRRALGLLRVAALGQRPRPLSQNLTVLPAPPKGEPMAAHGQQVLPQGFHLISLLRRQLPLKGKPLAAHG